MYTMSSLLSSSLKSTGLDLLGIPLLVTVWVNGGSKDLLWPLGASLLRIPRIAYTLLFN